MIPNADVKTKAKLYTITIKLLSMMQRSWH